MPNTQDPMNPIVQFSNAFAVDISATNHQFSGNKPQALYIGGAGDVIVDMGGDGTSITFKAVPVGTLLPIFATKVYKTGTTATNMLALS